MRVTNQQQSNIQLTVLITALGIISSALSATVGSMAGANHQPDTAIGTYISMFALGCFVSVPFGGMLADWKGKRRVVLFATGLLCLGLYAVSVSKSAVFMYAGLFITGIGFGPSESMSSALLADDNPQFATRWLSISQIGFGTGAVLAPLLIVWTAAQWQWTFRGVFAACATIILLLTVILVQNHLRRNRTAKPAAFQGNVFSVLRKPRMRMLALMIFLYLGFESVAPAYIKQYFLAAGASEPLGNAMISVFWGSMIICRFLGVFMDGRERLLIKALCVLVMAAVVVLLLGGGTAVSIAGVFLFGLGCGPIWPMLMSLAARTLPERSGAACSVMMLFSTAGMTLFPVLIGTLVGNIHVTFILCGALAGCLLLCTFRITNGAADGSPS